MRVIHVAPTPFGDAGLFGGGERYPLELARAMAGQVDCELVTFAAEPMVIREASGLTIRVLRPVATLFRHPAHPLACGLLRALRDADIVHTHHLLSTPSRLAAVAARIHDQRVVNTDHGLVGGDWFGILPRLFDRFLTVSEYSARTLGAPPDRTHVIYGGADTRRFTPGPATRRQGVLFVGRISPHKGLDRLIRALPAGATLTVAGSSGHDPRPPDSDYPALLVRLAADRSVRFAGPVPDGELPAVYQSAEVLALPSVERTCYGRQVEISELLGLSVLEAMASGLPVVASRVGGVPEIVADGETGFLVEPGNVDELHDRLALLLGDRALAARMGRRAREVVVERFTWKECAARCLAGYEELLATPPEPGTRSCWHRRLSRVPRTRRRLQ
jgi:glycosyltransferase involved in cell wall biosynthesis